jgi:hypothetical protein
MPQLRVGTDRNNLPLNYFEPLFYFIRDTTFASQETHRINPSRTRRGKESVAVATHAVSRHIGPTSSVWK